MGNKFVSAAGDNPLLKARPPADRRGAQMKAPSERAPRGKYAGGVLEILSVIFCQVESYFTNRRNIRNMLEILCITV